MARVHRLHLHIGVPKTGSSLIQKSLRNIRGPLRRRGVAYLDRKQMLRLPGYQRWASGTDGRPSKADFLDGIAETVEAVRSRGARKSRTVVASNEAAAGHARDFDEPFWPRTRVAVSDLVTAIQPRSTEVIVYVRRQDRLLESLYMERIHRGRTLTWEEFRDDVCRDERVRYTELMAEIAEVPTVDSIRVRPFEVIQEGAPSFVADFLDALGVADLIVDVPKKALSMTNPSYTEPAWRAALAVNPLLDDDDQVTKVRRFLRELFPVEDHPKAPLLTDDERRDLIERYRAENERLFREHMPGFPVDAYSTPEGLASLEGAIPSVEMPDGRPPPPRGVLGKMRSALSGVRRRFRR